MTTFNGQTSLYNAALGEWLSRGFRLVPRGEYIHNLWTD